MIVSLSMILSRLHEVLQGLAHFPVLAVEESVGPHLRPVAANPNVTSMSLAYLGRMGLGESLPALEQALIGSRLPH